MRLLKRLSHLRTVHQINSISDDEYFNAWDGSSKIQSDVEEIV